MSTNQLGSVVVVLTALGLTPVVLGQAQRSEALTEPQPRPSNLRPYLSEPSASGGLGGGTDGTTPILFESAKLTAADGTARDNFGFSVATSGDIVVVGAPGDDDNGIRSGSAYVFRFNGTDWIEEQKLIASDGAFGDDFGNSVSTNGDVTLVGAHRDDDNRINSGSAYIFRWNPIPNHYTTDGSWQPNEEAGVSSWVQEQKLLPADGAAYDFFGGSVSVSRNTAMVGASSDDDKGVNSGSVYVFRHNPSGWVQEQKLLPSDASAVSFFGESISVSGDVAVVGAWGDEDNGIQSGSAYVYRFDGTRWVEEQKLTASHGAAFDYFGISVSASVDTIVVGAFGDNCIGGEWCGAAYVYRFNGTNWVEEQKLVASDAEERDIFGVSVSLSGGTVVVVASGDDCAAGNECGSAYVFRFNGTDWIEEQKLTSSDAKADDRFGRSVSLIGDTAVVGAPGGDCAAAEHCGAAYMFEMPPPALEVAIDIKPGNDTNPVNLVARGVLPVAVLTTSVADGDLIDFDAADVDPSSLTLAGAAPRMKGRSGRVGSLADIDGDGDFDLLVHFPIAELALEMPEDGDGGPCPPYVGNGGSSQPNGIGAPGGV